MFTSSEQARAAAKRLHAGHDCREFTSKARKAFLSRFDDAPDPQAARSEYFRQIRARSAKKDGAP